jgi:PPM family protein phosphatase
MTLNSFEDNLIGWFLRKTAATAIRRVADLPAVVASSTGLVRKENQDRVGVFRFADISGGEYVLIVLCDGMGGMSDGARCAATAIASFTSEVIRNANRFHLEHTLFEAVLTANRKVYDSYRGTGGATLSALLILPNSNERYWVNIGDSRIHEFQSGSLKQVTVDDTLAGQLAREPESYTGRNELLQFVGMGAMAEPHVHREEKKDNGFSYVITSDGVHFLPPNMLRDLLLHSSEPAIAARRLIDLATWCGGHDNASLAIASFSHESWGALSPIQLDSIEVWDPYGDARFFGVSRYYHRRNASATLAREITHLTEVGFSGSEDGNAALRRDQLLGNGVEPDVKQVSADESSRRTVVKKKKSTKKKDASNAQAEKPVESVPQLTINFRKKD